MLGLYQKTVKTRKSLKKYIIRLRNNFIDKTYIAMSPGPLFQMYNSFK